MVVQRILQVARARFALGQRLEVCGLRPPYYLVVFIALWFIPDVV